MKTAVVIPAYNEEKFISEVVRQCRLIVNLVIVINDGSNDNTGLLAQQQGAKVIDLPENTGVGNALKTGFRFALEMGVQTVITVDADGAHDPSEIGSVLNAHFTGRHSLTIGTRFDKPDAVSQIPSQKRWSNLLATALVNRIARTKLSDALSGFRVLNEKILRLGLLAESKGYGFLPEMIFLANSRGLVIGESHISVRYNTSQPLYLSGKELCHFLDICLAWSNEKVVLAALSSIREKAQKLEMFGIRLSNPLQDEARMIEVVAQPIPEYLGYLIRTQGTLSEQEEGWSTPVGIVLHSTF